MAFWICRLDSDIDPASLPGAKACGVQGWLLQTSLTPSGLEPPAAWSLYRSHGDGLPFCLECRLDSPFTPTDEALAAQQVAHWLAQEDHLMLQGRPLLVLSGARNFSHPKFASQVFRLLLGKALRKQGISDSVLLLCWQDDPVPSADGVIDQLCTSGSQLRSLWKTEAIRAKITL